MNRKSFSITVYLSLFGGLQVILGGVPGHAHHGGTGDVHRGLPLLLLTDRVQIGLGVGYVIQLLPAQPLHVLVLFLRGVRQVDVLRTVPKPVLLTFSKSFPSVIEKYMYQMYLEEFLSPFVIFLKSYL